MLRIYLHLHLLLKEYYVWTFCAQLLLISIGQAGVHAFSIAGLSFATLNISGQKRWGNWECIFERSILRF